jgi:hypothetical protein
MNVLDVEGTIRQEEWEAAGIYRIFAFRLAEPGELQSPPELPPMSVLVPAQVARAHPGFGYKASLATTDIADLMG